MRTHRFVSPCHDVHGARHCQQPDLYAEKGALFSRETLFARGETSRLMACGFLGDRLFGIRSSGAGLMWPSKPRSQTVAGHRARISLQHGWNTSADNQLPIFGTFIQNRSQILSVPVCVAAPFASPAPTVRLSLTAAELEKLRGRFSKALCW